MADNNNSNNHAHDGSGSSSADARASEATPRRRSPWPLAVVAALFIIVPFLAWYGTWFGRALDDRQIGEYLADAEKPRHIQHALSEIEKRISARDESAKRWYAQIAALAGNESADVRLTAAWTMGADTGAEEFHQSLLRLVEDSEPIVRRNAALSLVSFGDARGLPELRAMLKPYTVLARAEGTALTTLGEGARVRRGAMLMRVELKPGETYEVRSPLDGKVERALVREGGKFHAGDALFVLAPDAVSVGDALLGLERFGAAEDLPEVERYARGVEGMPDYVKRRAAQTAEAIKRRSR